jgi:hypothetical protein
VLLRQALPCTCHTRLRKRPSVQSLTRMLPCQVGIIPTDTLPALVCDPESRSAVLKLYDIKDLSLKKQLSLLCRGFADIAHYTTGFPTALEPGEQDVFTRVRKILPGPVSPSTNHHPALQRPAVCVHPHAAGCSHRWMPATCVQKGHARPQQQQHDPHWWSEHTGLACCPARRAAVDHGAKQP